MPQKVASVNGIVIEINHELYLDGEIRHFFKNTNFETIQKTIQCAMDVVVAWTECKTHANL